MTQCPICSSYNYSGLAWCTSCAAKDVPTRLRPWFTNYMVDAEGLKEIIESETDSLIHLKSGVSLDKFAALYHGIIPRENLDKPPHPSYLPVPPSTASRPPTLSVLSLAAVQHAKHLASAEKALALHDFDLFNYHLAQCNSIALYVQTIPTPRP